MKNLRLYHKKEYHNNNEINESNHQSLRSQLDEFRNIPNNWNRLRLIQNNSNKFETLNNQIESVKNQISQYNSVIQSYVIKEQLLICYNLNKNVF